MPTATKTKDKEDGGQDVYYIDVDSDEEMIPVPIVKQEIKEEPVSVVSLLSSGDEEDDDIQVLKENCLDKDARRAMWRRKDRTSWKGQRTNPPIQGTSSSFANGHRPVRRLSPQNRSRPPPVVAPAAVVGTGTPSLSSGGQSQPNGNPVPPIVHAATQNSVTGGGSVPEQRTQSQSNTPNISHSTQFNHTTINVQFELGKSLVLDVPGQPQWRITAVQSETNMNPPPPPSPPKPTKSTDCQTGPSVLNGVFIPRRRNIDLSQPPPPPQVPITVSAPMATSGQQAQSSSTPNQNSNAIRSTNNVGNVPLPLVRGSVNTDTPRDQPNSTPAEDSLLRRDRARSPQNTSRSRHRSRSHHQERSASRVRNKSRHRSGIGPQRANVDATSPPPTFTTSAELIKIIKTCKKCKETFSTRDKGVAHQRSVHCKKYCPICFKLISRSGNAWRNHIADWHQVLMDDDGVEKAKCRFCLRFYEFDGVYQHLSRNHLLNVERRENNPQPLSPPVASTSVNTSASSTRPVPLDPAPPTTHTGAATPTATVKMPLNNSYSSSTNNMANGTASHTNTVRPTSNSSTNKATVPTTQGTGAGTARFRIPKRPPQAAVQRSLSSTSRHPRANVASDGGGGSYMTNAELENAVSAVHIGRLNLLYNQHRGIPDMLEIKAISSQLGVVQQEITKWFVRKHQDQCQRAKRIFPRKKK